MKTLIAILWLFLVTNVYAVSISWTANDPSEHVTQYKVYRVEGNSSQLVATVNAPETSVNVDSFLSSGQTKFYVTAFNGAGESLGSSKVSIKKH